MFSFHIGSTNTKLLSPLLTNGPDKLGRPDQEPTWSGALKSCKHFSLLNPFVSYKENSVVKMVAMIQNLEKVSKLGPYSQDFIGSITYKWA